jgi:hypothetical protein
MFALFSCGEKHPCPAQPMLAVYKGYTMSEVDTIIVKRFQKGSSFSLFKDSIVLTGFLRQMDSTYLIYSNVAGYFDGSHDIQYINPFDHRTVSVSDVVIENASTRSSIFAMDPGDCYSPVVSYKVNGTTVNNTNEVLIKR